MLVIKGGQDNWTPPAPCKAFIEAARARGEPVEFVLYETAAHSFDAPNLPLRRRIAPQLKDGSYPLIGTDEAARSDALKRVINFFDHHMRTPAELP